VRKLREIPVQCRARRAVVVAGCLAILTSSASLQAEEPTPGALFEQGQAAFAAKRFRQAAEHFEHAYRLSPTSQAAYNAGLAWDGADERARAANTLTRAINLGGLSKDELREASRRLAQLLPTLGKISISAPMGTKVRVGELELGVPGSAYVDPGRHPLKAVRPDGTALEREVTVAAGETTTVSFDDTPRRSSEPKPAPLRPAEPEPKPKPSATPPKSHVLSYVSFGAAAVALGVGAYLNVRGASANDDFEASHYTDSGARDRAVGLRTGAFVAYGAGLAFGALGTILLFGPSSEGTSARLDVAPTGARCSVRF